MKKKTYPMILLASCMINAVGRISFLLGKLSKVKFNIGIRRELLLIIRVQHCFFFFGIR